MERLESFLREQLGSHAEDLEAHAAQALHVSSSEVERAVRELVDRGEFEEVLIDGRRNLRWKPALRAQVTPDLEENRLWSQFVEPKVAGLPPNVVKILHYATTEMINNVIDHSGARELVVVVRRLPEETEVYVEDDGDGIFEKLRKAKGLDDPQHVALELSKGKLTTDPDRHTGHGIFFSSQMCDKFLVWSDSTVCGHVQHDEWQVVSADPRRGTTIRMVVRHDTPLTPRRVFDEFFPEGADGAFIRTRIPVSLLLQNGAGLVSRSQAKRLLARCDEFEQVVLDFARVEAIGPAFADEVFRVYASKHPKVGLEVVNANPEVLRMIAGARRRPTA